MHLDWYLLRANIAVFVVTLAVLIFFVPQTKAYFTYMPASIVIGQKNFSDGSSNQGGNVSAQGFNLPTGVASDGTRLFVADFNNNRVLVFNHMPTSNNATADVVIGQPDFSSNGQNQNGSPSANTIKNPRGVFSDGTRLFIADTGNNRILVFNTMPSSNNTAADLIIGQPDMFTVSPGTNANKFHNPYNMFVDKNTGKLFIADDGNQRVLIFNTIPTKDNASADVVVGQTNFISSGGSATSGKFSRALSAIVADNKLVVDDYSDSRVLIWNTVPTTNGAIADVVIGQKNFTSSSANQGQASPSANTLYWPVDIGYDGKRLYVLDGNNFRLLIYNSIPTTNNISANFVIGQSDFISRNQNAAGTATPSTLRAVNNLLVLDDKIILSDWLNQRVLIYSDELPFISLSRTITGQPNGLLRFSGTATTSAPNQHVVQVEYSINGSTWTGAFPTDGSFDSATENYYFDFDPTVNEMADQQGFTIKIRSTHDNDIDTSKAALYFQPFLTNAPANNSFTLNRLPSFTFTNQKQRFADLKENLDHFRVMVKTDSSDWQPYIDNIPVDYNSVRLAPDNLQPNQVDTMNGTYEDKFKTVTYDQENSVITVRAKAVDSQGNASDKFWGDGGQLLNDATYQWKVQAEDHEGQFEDTDPQMLRIGTRQVVTSRPYFLLSIYAISGIPGYMDISTNHPDDAPKTLTMMTDNPKFAPTFAGHAFAGSTVTFAIMDDTLATSSACIASSPDPRCTQTYQTTVKPDSTFRITVPKAFRPGNSYDVTASVKDTGDNYNELPTFTVQVAAM